MQSLLRWMLLPVILWWLSFCSTSPTSAAAAAAITTSKLEGAAFESQNGLATIPHDPPAVSPVGFGHARVSGTAASAYVVAAAAAAAATFGSSRPVVAPSVAPIPGLPISPPEAVVASFPTRRPLIGCSSSHFQVHHQQQQYPSADHSSAGDSSHCCCYGDDL